MRRMALQAGRVRSGGESQFSRREERRPPEGDSSGVPDGVPDDASILRSSEITTARRLCRSGGGGVGDRGKWRAGGAVVVVPLGKEIGKEGGVVRCEGSDRAEARASCERRGTCEQVRRGGNPVKVARGFFGRTVEGEGGSRIAPAAILRLDEVRAQVVLQGSAATALRASRSKR